jgi:hypothetical protein
MTAPRSARMGRRHQEAVLTSVLAPEQAQRLRQIILQRQGGLALGTRQVADELAFSDSQRAQADTIVDQLNQARNTGGAEWMKQAEESRKTAGENLLALLGTEQQERWKSLQGEPFTGEIRLGRGPGGGPKGGPGGDPRGGPGGGPKAGPGGGPGGGPKRGGGPKGGPDGQKGGGPGGGPKGGRPEPKS